MVSPIASFLSPHAVILDIRAPSKLALLHALSQHASECTGLPTETILAEINKRESLGSTGMGDGVALPHANYEALGQTFGLAARVKPAVDFEAIDGKPVDLVFLLLTSAASEKSHLNALAAISRRLRNRELRQKLRGASDPETFYNLLISDAPCA